LNQITSLPSLREIAAVVFRRKWLVFGAFLIPLLACAAAPFLTVPVYEAQARVLVKVGREFIPQSDQPGGAHGPSTTMREMVDTVTQIITSVDVAQDVLRDFKVERLYPKIDGAAPAGVTGPPDAAGPTSEGAALRAFMGDLIVSPVRLTNVIEIKLRNGDRQIAIDALKTTLARFQERHVRAWTHSRTGLLEAEISDNLRLLAEVQEERAQYIATHNLFSLAEQRGLLIQQRIHRAQELQEAEMLGGSLDRLIAYLKAELDRQPPTITLQTTTQPSNVAEDAQRRQLELRQRERELLATLSAEHPQVRAVRGSLAATQQALAQTTLQTAAVSTGINPLITTLKTQLATAEADRAPVGWRIASLKAAIEADDIRLRQISAVEAELRRLDTRITDIEAATSLLRQRLADARVSDQLDRAHVAGLSVIQHPVALDRPISPRKTYFFLGGIVLSALSGGAAVLAVLTFSNRFIAADTIERLLGVPVLAVLPVGRDGPGSARPGNVDLIEGLPGATVQA
jgi:uncharacterized protein involved in exopolysaccharide biosynthesis